MKRLTKSQYEVVASCFKWFINADRALVTEMADDLANRLGHFDDQFDKQKFLKQCGIED